MAERTARGGYGRARQPASRGAAAQTQASAGGRREHRTAKTYIAQIKSMDFAILLTTLALVCFGLVMVFSSSYYYAELRYGDGLFYFKKQVIGAVIGFIVMVILINFNYRRLEKLKWLILIVSIGLLGLVLVPGVGVTLNEASRWLNIAGISIQPAEIGKFALVLFMASYLAQNQKSVHKFRVGVFPMLILVGLFCGLIILQPNFSTVINICLLSFVLLYAGGVRIRHLIPIVLAAVVVLVYVLTSADYRMQRYQVFLDPWADPQDAGYQLVQSLYAIGAGGFFGTGLGASRQKLLFLPYGESDFIFSIIAEELGFLGVIVVLLLFAILIWRGIKVAINCPDLFGSLLAVGIVSMVGIQAIINIAVATGSIPPTGVPLPFISAGLSSLIIFMASIGLLLSVSRFAKKT
ncbi:MAG: putative lipid II flippase FtsW [Christensenellales bacterium]|jgi:cell division protein FtsW